jgi:hypothetical protein
MQSESTLKASESHAQRRNADHLATSNPQSFYAETSGPGLLASLRIVLCEIGRSARRIRGLLSSPYIPLEVRLRSDPQQQSWVSPQVENRFLCSCMLYIQRLEKDSLQGGPYDLQLAARSFRDGAIWAFDNIDKSQSNSDA